MSYYPWKNIFKPFSLLGYIKIFQIIIVVNKNYKYYTLNLKLKTFIIIEIISFLTDNFNNYKVVLYHFFCG